MHRRIAKNISTNWICYGISLAIMFFLTPFVIRHIGVSMYGFWILINSVVGYFGIMDIGVSAAIVRYVSVYDAKGEHTKINELMSTSFVVYIFLGAVCLLIIGVLSFFMPKIFIITPEFISIVRLTVLIVGINIAISMPMSIFGGFLRGVHRFDLPNISILCVFLLNAVGVFYFLKKGYGITALALITLATNLFGYLMNIVFAFFCRKNLKISFSFFNKKALKTIFGYGVFAFIMRIGHMVILYTDRVVIGIFLGPASVAFYSIGCRLVECMRQIIVEAVCVVGPTAGDLHAKEDSYRLKQLVVKGTKYALMLSLIIGIMLFFIGKPFLNLWMGAEFATKSTPVLLVLAMMEIFAAPVFVGAVVAMALNKHRPVAYLMSLEAAMNLTISIILLKFFGILGVALGSVIAFLPRFFFLVRYVPRLVGFEWKEYVKSAMVPPILAAFTAIIFIPFIGKCFINTSYWGLILRGIMFALCFCISCVFICFSSEERRKTSNKIKGSVQALKST